jgi:ribosomal protein L37AE/L43A
MANIFGWEIPFFKKIPSMTINDLDLESAPEKESPSTPISKIPSVNNPALHYLSTGASKPANRARLIPPEYDLIEVGRVEDVESYVRQAFKKKTALMFKEGFDYTGENTKVTKYIKTRLAQIAKASSIPHEELLRRIGSYIIKRSNAFLIKIRDREASGGKVRVDSNGKEIEPIAAYFPAPPEMMFVAVDDNGKVLKWIQRTPNGIEKQFDPEDVVHFYFDRKEGFLFGCPTLVPVMDDIRALRRIEENVELLIYKHLFPLFHYKVGTETAPAGLTETGEREVDIVRREIQYMPTEGGIVTPERHEIEAIGAESRALRAESYLEHFKRRVFSGLGCSAVDFGEGDTSNKATSDNMSLALIDDVKDFQEVLETQFTQFVISELLLESTFGAEVLDEQNKVQLSFREIDIDKQIKIQNHAADQFSKNATTWDELRIAIGKKPIPVPEDGEDQDLTKFPEWGKTFWKLFHEPEQLISAVDEPFGSVAQAVAESRSTALTPTTNTTAGEAGVKAEKEKAEIEKEKAIAVARVKRVKKDNFLTNKLHDVRDDIINEAIKNNGDVNFISLLLEVNSTSMINDLENRMMSTFRQSLKFDNRYYNSVYINAINFAATLFKDRANFWVNKLTKDILRAINRRIDSVFANDKISKELRVSTIRAIFDSIEYRASFIADVEIRKAYNWGIVTAGRLRGESRAYFISTGTCEECLRKSKDIHNIWLLTIDDIIPHHGSCGCKLVLDNKRSNIDCVYSDAHEEVFKNTESCPKCGKTAILKKDTPDIYNCRACGYSFRVDRKDAIDLNERLKKIKDQLRKKYPKASENEILSKASAIYEASISKAGGK